MSSKTFQLDIITPNGSYAIGKVDYLRAPSLDGLFGVLANHIPSIVAIGIGEIKQVGLDVQQMPLAIKIGLGIPRGTSQSIM